MAYDINALIANIKRRGSVPTSQNLLQTADFIALANDELEINLVPDIMSVREEYFVAPYLVPLSPSMTTVQIPTRAVGGKLLDVQLVTSNQIIQLPRLLETDRSSTNPNTFGFFVQGNTIQLSFTPDSSMTLNLVHYRRPNQLVATSACGQITAISTNTVTVSALPSTMVIGVTCDLVQANPGFDCTTIDQAITNVSGTTLTFASLPSNLSIGDWVCLSQQSPVPQIPQELHAVLAQMVVVKCLEALGDRDGMQIAEAKLEKMKASTLKMISPRIDDSPKKITNRNGLLANIRTFRRY